MFVYIKYNNGLRRIADVTLLNGYTPKCRHVTENRVDPALWYKTLVLDAIIVDCDVRNVVWRTADPDVLGSSLHTCHESEISVDTVCDYFKNAESVYQEDEFHDFDPAYNELFDIATDIFNMLSWEAVARDGNTEAFESVLRILHVFILPRVKFSRKYRTAVKEVLKEVEQNYRRIGDTIHEKDELMNTLEDELNEIRTQFLQEGMFSNASFVLTCKSDFLVVFLRHLEKFIVQCNDDLDNFGRKISPIRNSASKDDLAKLNVLRQERDKVYGITEKAVEAREEIKNAITRTRSNQKVRHGTSSDQQINAYLDISQRINTAKHELQHLIAINIKISSVREAVLLTLKEIDRDSYSYGYNCIKQTNSLNTAPKYQSLEQAPHASMDMSHSLSKQEMWKALTERVAECLQHDRAGLRCEHEKFCQRIQLQCQSLCDESRIFSFPGFSQEPDFSDNQSTQWSREQVSSDEPSTSYSQTQHVSDNQPLSQPSRSDSSIPDIGTSTNTDRKPNVDVRPSKRSSNNTWTGRCSIEIVPKSKCRQISEQIVSHIHDVSYAITKELFPEMEEIPLKLINRVYICYEEYVSSQLMSVLIKLYETSYVDVCPGLSAKLCNPRLSKDFCWELKLLYIIGPTRESSRSSNERMVSPGESPSQGDSSGDTSHSVENSGESIGETCQSSSNIRPEMDESDAGVDEEDVHELYTIFNQFGNSMPRSFTPAFDMRSDVSHGECPCDTEHCRADNVDVDNCVGNDDVSSSNDLDVESTCHSLNGCNAYNKDRDHVNNEESPVGVKQFKDSPYFHTDTSETCGQMHHKNYGVTESRKSVENKQTMSLTDAIRSTDNYDERKNAATYSALSQIFFDEFHGIDKFIEEEGNETTLFRKLHKTTAMVQYVETTLRRLRRESGNDAVISAQELVEIVQFLLCKMDKQLALKLYAHVNCMVDLRPSFVEGCVHEYALVTLRVAFENLLDA